MSKANFLNPVHMPAAQGANDSAAVEEPAIGGQAGVHGLGEDGMNSSFVHFTICFLISNDDFSR
jgi:hypothetical protein